MKTSMYEDVPKFPNLDLELCLKIKDLAQIGITREEVLEGHSLEWDQLMSEEKEYFEKQFKRGILAGKAEVARHLLKHSQERNGLPATMAYLRRFAKNYEKALDDSSSAAENFHFIFNQ